MSCSPRVSSPYHPEAQGKVERFNQTFKRMLHHVIRDHARDWYKYIPMLVWTVRESVNNTIGLSSYLLLYGRLPPNRLSLVKEAWEGKCDLPPNLGKDDAKYLEELRLNLVTAHSYAEQHAKNAQSKYAEYYNRWSKEKSFEVGDKVVVLYPDSTHKLRSQWQTGKVVEVRSPSSYLVDMPNGAKMQVHVNKLRPFVAKSNAVMYEVDAEFGDVWSLPVDGERDEPSCEIDRAKLSHLDDEQQTQLLLLLDNYADCFS